MVTCILTVFLHHILIPRYCLHQQYSSFSSPSSHILNWSPSRTNSILSVFVKQITAPGSFGCRHQFDLCDCTLIIQDTSNLNHSLSTARHFDGQSFCGSVVARVSSTLEIDVRERFFSAACRQYRFWMRCSCTVSSWRRSCCPGGASCCGLEERK